MIIRYSKKIDRDKLQGGFSRFERMEAMYKSARDCPPGPIVWHVCPTCGCNLLLSFTRVHGYIWNICEACKCAFVTNPPTFENLEKFYTRFTEIDHNPLVQSGDTTDAEFRKDEVFGPKLEFAQSLMEPNDNTWLDIGAGPGEVVKYLIDSGWDAVGVDPDQKARETAKVMYDIDIINTYLGEDIKDKLLHNRYSVISLFNLLEHMYEPYTALASISELQDVGDYLVVEVPHFPNVTAYLGAMFPDMVSRIITPPMHLYMFSIQSLSPLLREFGYKINAIWLFGQDFGELLDTYSLFSEKEFSLSYLLRGIIDDVQKIFDRNLICECMLLVARREE